jgi:hypothetical protein
VIFTAHEAQTSGSPLIGAFETTSEADAGTRTPESSFRAPRVCHFVPEGDAGALTKLIATVRRNRPRLPRHQRPGTHQQHLTAPADNGKHEFEFGLDLILEGLAKACHIG